MGATRFVRFAILFLSLFFWGRASAQDVPNEPKKIEDPSELGGVPAVFRSPETGLGLGAVLIYTADTTLKKPSPIMTGLMYTEKKQLLWAFGTKQIFEDGRYAFYSFGEVVKFPQKYYGIGNNTRKKDEEIYEERHYTLDFGGERNVYRALNLGFGLHTREDSFPTFEPTGFFAEKAVPGQEGGQQHGFMTYAFWDTTDDNFYPSTGTRIKLFYLKYLASWGSTYPFDEVKFDARDFRLLAKDTILATQFFIRNANGAPPFYQLSQLGGNELLRGYFKGRYRERQMTVLQTEIRHTLAKDWGAVLFTGVGNVYHNWDEFKPQKLKPSYGTGLRYQVTPKQKINLRLDVGIGEPREGPQFYLYIMEAY